MIHDHADQTKTLRIEVRTVRTAVANGLLDILFAFALGIIAGASFIAVLTAK